MVGCFLSVASGGSVPDLLRCLQSAQSSFASIVPPRRHHLPQESHALLGGLPLPGHPESTPHVLAKVTVTVMTIVWRLL